MSSVVPDIVFQKVLAAGFRALRRDSRLIDSVLKGIDQKNLAKMRKYVTEETIDFALNYPKADSLKVPALVLIMKSESEAQAFLGDVLGEYPNYSTPDPDLEIDVLGGEMGASTSGIPGLPRKLVGSLAAVRSYVAMEAGIAVTKIELNDTGDNLEEYYDVLRVGAVPAINVYIVAGTGVGQVLPVSGIENNVLDVVGTFDPHLDGTSIVDLRFSRDPEQSVGEPSRVYEPSKSLLRTGANFEATYQLAVLTGHPEETLWLFRIVKAILFSQKKFMESQGIMNLKLSGGDFIPREEMAPTEVFQKTLTLTFTYEFSFMEERDDLVDLTTIDFAVRTVFDSPCELTGLTVQLEGD